MVISILDYNMGNLSSVLRALSKNNIKHKVIRTCDEIIGADKIILPGVGHFGKGMDYLQSNKLDEALHKIVLEDKKPIKISLIQEQEFNGFTVFTEKYLVKFHCLYIYMNICKLTNSSTTLIKS